MYMSNWAELEDMISYGRTKKYFTGRQIKDIIKRCLNEDNLMSRKKELMAFNNSYIHCEYPLANNGLYSMAWDRETYSVLKCYKKK